jgi:pimeloyl-ACP methyl ester carboxylesterase
VAQASLALPSASSSRPRAEIVTGNGSSHVMPLERPDDFNQLVMDFLAPDAPADAR